MDIWKLCQSVNVQCEPRDLCVATDGETNSKGQKKKIKPLHLSQQLLSSSVSQTENMKRKVLRRGRKSIVTSEGTSKIPSLFCLYSRSWKGAAHQSLSLTGFNSFLFTMLQDGHPRSADTTGLEVCCHGRIYDMYTRTRYYYDEAKSKTKIFYTNKKETKFFALPSILVHGTRELVRCSISDVFIRPFGRVNTGMSYNWIMNKNNRGGSNFSETLHVTASACVTCVWAPLTDGMKRKQI